MELIKNILSHRLIDAPPRSTGAGSIIILAALVGLGMQVSTDLAFSEHLLWMFLVLTISAIIVRSIQAIHISFFCTLWAVISLAISLNNVWWIKALPVLVYCIVVLSLPGLRRSVFWLHIGRFESDIWKFMFVTFALSSIVLVTWYLVVDINMEPYLAQVSQIPLWILPFAGLFFIFLNAAVEEVMFRGIILQGLESALGSGTAAIIVQAALFGAMHHSEISFPKGLSGVLMAGVYGILLGYLRHRSRGMIAPWLVHVFTDGLIFLIVIRFMLKQ